MTTPEQHRESHDPSPTEPSQVKNFSGHPIHPTTSTSTPAQNTVDGSSLIAAERQRQVNIEGYSPDHDEHHHVDAFVKAAGAYLGLCRWPWTPETFKRADGDGYYVARNLVKAGALIAAALDRMNGTRPTVATEPSNPTCSRTDHLTSSCHHHSTTETTDQPRPVVGLVARSLDLDELDRCLSVGPAENEREDYLARAAASLVAEVRRLTEINHRLAGERADPVDRAEAAEQPERVVEQPDTLTWWHAYGAAVMAIGEDGDWVALGQLEPRNMVAAMRKSARDQLGLDDGEVFNCSAEEALANVEHTRAEFRIPAGSDPEWEWVARFAPPGAPLEGEHVVDVTVWRA